MDVKNNGETHIKILTDVCENVCSFIKTITVDSITKNDKMNNFELKVDKLECLCSSLKTQLEQINDLVKQLANSLNFTVNKDDSSIVLLTQLLLSLSKKDFRSVKKRKLYSSYSPLKLSLKEKTEVNDTTNNTKLTQLEKENKMSTSDNGWKLQIKRNGNPSDLLKKSKQTTLMFQSREEKTKMDITTLSTSTPIKPVFNISFSPEVLKNNDATIVSQNDLTHSVINSTQMEETNISLSHFNKIVKPKKNVLPIVKTNILKSNNPNTSLNQTENHDQLCNDTLNETFCSPIYIPMNVLKDATTSIKQTKVPNTNVLDSFDIIPGLNEKKNNLPDYKFKEDPVRKQNERKLLNGWDCEDCSKFYKANNDNPIEAKNAMNHFSRHRSVKHQHHALTPPGFWDPL